MNTLRLVPKKHSVPPEGIFCRPEPIVTPKTSLISPADNRERGRVSFVDTLSPVRVAAREAADRQATRHDEVD